MPQRNVTTRRAGSVASLALTLAFLSSGALAQPKPALVQNTNEPGLNHYSDSKQVEQNTTTCQPPAQPFGSCAFEMAPVPLGKRLVVTYVSASYYLSPGATFPEAILSAVGSGFVMLPLQPVQPGALADRQLVATPLTFYVEPGETPRITLRGFDILDGRTASLALVGYYVNLP